MRLSTLIKEDRVLIDTPGQTVVEGVDALLKLLAGELGEEKIEAIREVLKRRWNETTDYLKEGIAVPHARIEGLEHFYICLGTSKKGLALAGPVDSQTDGSERVHLLFLVLTPQTQNTLMLQALAAIARLCRSQDTRNALKSCRAPNRILRLIAESDVEVKKTVTATDVMRPCEYHLQPNDDLSTALRKLVKSGERALPVVDSQGILRGILHPSDLFRLGLPKYVDILSDMAFLSNFEPFERLFANEKKLAVSAVAKGGLASVEPEAPILLVAHLMVSMPASCIFVAEKDGRLQGVIDERDILARVLQP